jgi:mannosylglycoprotein endo-beta-mannosidase
MGLEVLKGAWASTPPIENPFKRLAAKLSATAKALSSWSDRFIGNNKLRILVANELILRLDVAMESRALSVEERGFRRLLKRKLLGLASLERTIARRHCRIHWLSEGNACTRFFHLHANHRRRKSFIVHLQVDGVLISDQDDKSKAVDSFYEQLLGTCPERGFDLDLEYPGMQSHDLSELEVPFMEEVWDVIRSQELDKAPGPDGFPGRFYTLCWPIIKADVMEAFHTLWRGDSRGLHVANQALIALLPKRADAVEVKDFRPISLIHSVAKLIAKVLSTRRAPTMPHLMGPHQSALIRGRCLHDNFELVQSTAWSLHRLKKAAILLKLNITKTFDTVD